MQTTKIGTSEYPDDYYSCKCSQNIVHATGLTIALAAGAYFSSEIKTELKSLSQYEVSLPSLSISPTFVMGCCFCCVSALVMNAAGRCAEGIYNEVNRSNSYGGLIFYLIARAVYWGAFLATIGIGIMTLALGIVN